ncbi:MAG TPA: hypothetical protein VJ182_03425 [Anaerolineales bacterium]|nr:hypothetical protein [Anaerolineales bacterium]
MTSMTFRPRTILRLAAFLLGALAACSPQAALADAAAAKALIQTEAPSAAVSATSAPAAQPSATPLPTPLPDTWQTAPIIPESLSQRARDTYALGRALGRNPRAFSKVGDCGGTPAWFLGPFDLGDYKLGDYSSLQEVIDFYSGSYNRTSKAVHNGFNAASILSSIRADPEFCESGEHPLGCEFRLNNPSLALIMVGTNDKYRVAEFEGAMRLIIEYSIDQGILPVIASKPDNLEGDHSLNRILYALALEYELPFWNLWGAMQDLPNGGLQEDGAHLVWAPNDFSNVVDMRAGWPNRNLSALQVLDSIWSQLENDD